MTLIIGISKPDGLYLSTDYRVTRGSEVVDDASVKHLTVQYPPYPDGPVAVFAYTGLASSSDGTPTGDWLRETLRGGKESLRESMGLLRTRLDRDYPPQGVMLQVIGLVIHGDERLLVGVTNVRVNQERTGYEVLDHFRDSGQRLEGPIAVVAGSGMHVAERKHMSLLHGQLPVWPRNPKSHMNLLATVNRRVAAEVQSASPMSHVVFVPGTSDSGGPRSRVYAEQGESAPFVLPQIAYGVDLYPMALELSELRAAQKQGAADTEPATPEDLAAMTRQLQRRP